MSSADPHASVYTDTYGDVYAVDYAQFEDADFEYADFTVGYDVLELATHFGDGYLPGDFARHREPRVGAVLQATAVRIRQAAAALGVQAALAASTLRTAVTGGALPAPSVLTATGTRVHVLHAATDFTDEFDPNGWQLFTPDFYVGEFWPGEFDMSTPSAGPDLIAPVALTSTAWVRRFAQAPQQQPTSLATAVWQRHVASVVLTPVGNVLTTPAGFESTSFRSPDFHTPLSTPGIRATRTVHPSSALGQRTALQASAILVKHGTAVLVQPAAAGVARRRLIAPGRAVLAHNGAGAAVLLHNGVSTAVVAHAAEFASPGR